MADLPRLTALEAAGRLGVKTETLYAYVSRGLLQREKSASGSSFDPLEVERFAATRRRSAGTSAALVHDGRPAGTPLMTIDTDVALLEDDRLYFRGRRADQLAESAAFETVCWWLWTRDWDDDIRFEGPPGHAVSDLVAALPRGVLLRDRIQIAVSLLAAMDPLRQDLSELHVAKQAGRLIAGVLDSLPARSKVAKGERRIAARLWAALSDRRPDPDELHVLNAAMILLVDHDLAVSTLAVRAAASARADPYAVVTSGLGALDSPLHGNVSRAAYAVLAQVVSGVPAEQAIARAIAATRGGVPGFGHRIYRTADPRAEAILGLLATIESAEPTLSAVTQVRRVVTSRTRTFVNVDLALAALAMSAGMSDDAGEAIFSLARCGGWVAHALHEYQQPALRLRPVGRYVGS